MTTVADKIADEYIGNEALEAIKEQKPAKEISNLTAIPKLPQETQEKVYQGYLESEIESWAKKHQPELSNSRSEMKADDAYQNLIRNEIRNAGGAKEFISGGDFKRDPGDIAQFMSMFGKKPSASQYYKGLAASAKHYSEEGKKKSNPIVEKALKAFNKAKKTVNDTVDVVKYGTKEQQMSHYKDYQKALQHQITEKIQQNGGPKAWGEDSFSKIVQLERKNPKVLVPGLQNQRPGNIERFQKAYGQKPDVEQYKKDLQKALEKYQEPFVLSNSQQHEMDVLAKDHEINEKRANDALEKAFDSTQSLEDYAYQNANIKGYNNNMLTNHQNNYLNHAKFAGTFDKPDWVTKETLKRNQIPLTNLEVRGVMPNKDGKLEPVFKASDLTKTEQQKLESKQVFDSQTYSIDDKAKAVEKHGKPWPKPTGDPDKDLELAKGFLIDYHAKKQMGLLKSTAKPKLDGLNLSKMQSMTPMEKQAFMDDVHMGTNAILGKLNKTMQLSKSIDKKRENYIGQTMSIKPTIKPKQKNKR